MEKGAIGNVLRAKGAAELGGAEGSLRDEASVNDAPSGLEGLGVAS